MSEAENAQVSSVRKYSADSKEHLTDLIEVFGFGSSEVGFVSIEIHLWDGRTVKTSECHESTPQPNSEEEVRDFSSKLTRNTGSIKTLEALVQELLESDKPLVTLLTKGGHTHLIEWSISSQ